MRRSDREVKEQKEIEDIIRRCKTCYVAMANQEEPYLVPLNFGYEIEAGRLVLYFHSAGEGKKLDILRKNHRVCFAIAWEGGVTEAEKPCGYGYRYASVIGFGDVIFLEKENISEKCKALSLLMRHQAGTETQFTKEQTENLCIYKIVSEDYTGKKRT